MAEQRKARLIKFGSKTCGACVAMDRAKTLERFADKHPGITVLKLDVTNEEGDAPPAKALGEVDYAKNYKVSDDYEVEGLPTLVMEVEGLGEVGRIEGAANLKQLEELYDAYEDALAAVERSNALPWGL